MRARTVFLSLLSLVGGVLAQTTGQIEGVVRDPSGMPAPDTALRISETGTGAERRLRTDQRGWYLAPGLVPGLYEIEVSRTGFRSAVRRGVELVAGRAVRVDFLLQLGELRESVVGRSWSLSRSTAGTCSISPRSSRALRWLRPPTRPWTPAWGSAFR
jgi:hypothetical protein